MTELLGRQLRRKPTAVRRAGIGCALVMIGLWAAPLTSAPASEVQVAGPRLALVRDGRPSAVIVVSKPTGQVGDIHSQARMINRAVEHLSHYLTQDDSGSSSSRGRGLG